MTVLDKSMLTDLMTVLKILDGKLLTVLTPEENKKIQSIMKRRGIITSVSKFNYRYVMHTNDYIHVKAGDIIEIIENGELYMRVKAVKFIDCEKCSLREGCNPNQFTFCTPNNELMFKKVKDEGK